jgi:RNA polymerase sigma factor (sigma-70 family)
LRGALIELAAICDAGSRSSWPSSKQWVNSEAWQNTYMALSTRIAKGTIEVDRPLRGLAYKTARNFFLSERRRERRLSAIGDEQVERHGAGEVRSPDELAEAERRGEVLRSNLVKLAIAGKVSESDLFILARRYVDEWSASEVAGATGLAADNVRQICARRCRLLRQELAGMGLEETA